MSNLSSSYAKALFEIALERNKTDVIYEQGKMVSQLLAENPDFVKLLCAPTVSGDDKRKVIETVFSQDFDTDFVNFFKVMIDRKEADALQDALTEYKKMYFDYKNIEQVTALTVVAMPEELKSKLCTKLEQITGKTILLENKISKNVLGGIVLEFSDRQIDDSIKGKLDILKAQLRSIY